MQENQQVMLQGFERSLEVEGIRSRADYLVRVREFLGWAMERGHTWESVTPGLQESWTADLIASGLNRRTVNNKLNTLKRWGAWLKKTQRMRENPMAEVQNLKVGPTLPKHILSIEDLGTLLTKFRLRRPTDIMAKAVLELLYGSGLRISEAEILKDQDLDRMARVVKIYEPKTDKERRVPVTDAFLQALDQYMKDFRVDLVKPADIRAGFLFPQGKKTTLRGRINGILKRESSRLGLGDLTSHTMRHMAATHLLKKGAGIRHVQAFLGHESLSSTEVYTRVCKEDLKKVMENCHPLEMDYVG